MRLFSQQPIKIQVDRIIANQDAMLENLHVVFAPKCVFLWTIRVIVICCCTNRYQISFSHDFSKPEPVALENKELKEAGCNEVSKLTEFIVF